MASSMMAKESTSVLDMDDKKTRKITMELRRREIMNKYLDDLKLILLRYSPNNTSKLEKNDILRETLNLVKFLEIQIAQIRQQTVLAIIAGLVRNQADPEVIKAVQKVVGLLFFQSASLPPPPRQQPPPPQVPTQPAASASIPRFPAMPHPIFSTSMNPLFFTQKVSPFSDPFVGKPPMMTSTPKFSSKATTSSSSPTTSEANKSSNSSTDNLVDSETSNDSCLSSLEKSDDSPKIESSGSRKRRNQSFSSSLTTNNDDSGISEDAEAAPSSSKKQKFSIDDLLKEQQ